MRHSNPGDFGARLEELFQQASDLDPRNRPAFLAAECAGDQALHQAIERLLQASERAEENSAWTSAFINEGHFTAAEEVESWGDGCRLDRYEMLERIGAGGMGVVYKAVRSDDAYSKVVAIKIVQQDVGDAVAIARFRNERQILANLEHPNIARLLDGGETKDGQPFLVMEYVDGKRVDRYVKARRLAVREILQVFRKLSSAISHAHANLVVHRDLKPANILVTEDGEPKLVDFGIAKLLDCSAQRTATGAAALTPEYASPEQLRGEPVTTASDIYSLGVLLYQLLSGELPYADTTNPVALARAICDEPPLPLPRVDPDLETILQMALRKEPARRYTSVEQFSEDIRRYLEGFPVRAKKGTLRYRASKFIRRNWLTVAAASIIAIMLVASLVVTTAQRNRADRERHHAEAAESSNRHLLYAAQMNLAYQAWETPNIGRTLKLLEAQRPTSGQNDLRGFDWYLLWRLVSAGSRVLVGPGEIVNTVTFSASSQRVAASAGQRAYVWEAKSGTLLHSFETNSVALFTPDGRFFAARDSQGSVMLWDADSGQPARAFQVEKGDDEPLGFSPDGQLLATRSHESSVRLWEVNSGRSIATLKGHRDFVDSATFSPDAHLVATTSRDHTAKLWNVASGKETATLNGHSWWVLRASFSPNGALLATVGSDGDVKLWDVQSRRAISTIPGGGTTVDAVQFSPDGKTLAIGGLEDLVKIYDVASRRLLDTLRGHTDSITSVAFSPDGRTLVSSASDRTVRLWDLTKKPSPLTLAGHKDWISDVKFSPDGQTLGTASKDSTVKLWNASDGRELMTLHHPRWVNGLAFSPDGASLATADDDKLVRVWDPASGRIISELKGHTAVVECVAYSPDGMILASGSKNGEIALWDRHNWKRIANLRAPNPNIIWSLEFSPDGEYLVAAEGGLADGIATGHSVTVWHPATQRIVATLAGHSRDARAARFSPDGHTIATGSHDGTIKLWDLKTHREIDTLSAGHKVDSLVFSADGKRLASAGQDKTIKLWDVATWQEVCVLRVPSQINAVAFSPNNRVLAAVSNDGMVRLWRAAANDEARQ